MADSVSVIIPAYNCASSIIVAVRSVLSQSKKNWELIIVDDHSTDKTWEVISELAKLDGRIKIIKTKMGKGASAARNTGIKLASFEYIFFLDSDDKIHRDCLMLLSNALVEHQADIAVSNQVHIKKAVRKDVVFFLENTLLDKRQIDEYIQYYSYAPYSRYMFVHCWGRIYLKSVIEKAGIEFNHELSQFEDVNFNLQYLSTISKCVVVKEKLYEYVVGDNQNSMSFKTGSCGNIVNALWLAFKPLDSFFGVGLSGDAVRKVKINAIGGMLMVIILRLCRNFMHTFEFKNIKIILDISSSAVFLDFVNQRKPLKGESKILYWSSRSKIPACVVIAGMIRVLYLKIRHGY
ncbi:hypothetical protein BUE93_17575 [Chromobacterium amazonense]|uniref:Glycosyltransferase 2-like domain-containing protein n=1 Tax=Chromobacterium amazonense TaxID=1382803 RepID=A0A2S9X1I5_9NEIS|nr:glycosyltransferase family 2 protein [Chromobacterium amazonense]PRP69578.1 hypothetical protein BUE93_17575 [Chromobacterium amazonense]